MVVVGFFVLKDVLVYRLIFMFFFFYGCYYVNVIYVNFIVFCFFLLNKGLFVMICIMGNGYIYGGL